MPPQSSSADRLPPRLSLPRPTRQSIGPTSPPVVPGRTGRPTPHPPPTPPLAVALRPPPRPPRWCR
eukprot:6184106-Pleurochrysis_carterae.AAC.1